MITQDTHHRIKDSAKFQEILKLRQKEYTTKINNAMSTLVSGTHQFAELHEELVNLGTFLNTMISSYTGTFEAIHPRLGENFDSRFHALENSYMDSDGAEAGIRGVAMTVAPGLRYQLPGRDWRVCVRAKVILVEPSCSGQTAFPEPVQRTPSRPGAHDIFDLTDDHSYNSWDRSRSMA